MNNIQSKQMNILYYSKFSTMCTDLLKLMDSYGVLNKFFLKCIDDMEILPKGLERIPTLIVVGVNKPLVAREAMEWFDSMRPMFSQQNNDMLSKKIMFNIMKNNTEANNGPKGYVHCEYDGVSDSFAYTNTDLAQPKTFCEFENDGSVIYTPQSEDKTMAIKDSEQKRYINDLQKNRKQQESEFSNIMRQGQIDAVIDRERTQMTKNRLGIN